MNMGGGASRKRKKKMKRGVTRRRRGAQSGGGVGALKWSNGCKSRGDVEKNLWKKAGSSKSKFEYRTIFFRVSKCSDRNSWTGKICKNRDGSCVPGERRRQFKITPYLCFEDTEGKGGSRGLKL